MGKKNNLNELTDEQKNRNFVQVNKDYMMDLALLGKQNPNALTLFLFISQNMDGNNALCISMKALQEALSLSRSTLSRAVKYLKDKGWLCVLKTGTSNVYIINPEIEWTSYANQRKYCRFETAVIVSPSENVNWVQNPKASQRMKHIDDDFIQTMQAKRVAYMKELDELLNSGEELEIECNDSDQLPGQLNFDDITDGQAS